jgi:hypothetical protein
VVVVMLVLMVVCVPSAGAVTGVANQMFGDTRVGEVQSVQLGFVAERLPSEPSEAIGAASVEQAGAADFVITDDTCSNSSLVASCKITIAFRPTSVGAREAVLRVPGARGVAEVALRGAAYMIGRRIETNADGIGFSITTVGSESFAERVVITNTGDLDVRLTVGLGGRNADAFFIPNSACTGVNLPPGQTCTPGIVMRPVGTGIQTGELIIGCDAGCVPVKVMLRGDGTLDPCPTCGSSTFTATVPWSFYALTARATRSYIRVLFYSSLPAKFDVRVRRNGRIVARRRLREGPGRSAVRIRVGRTRRGRRPSVEVLARRGDESRLDRLRLGG